MCSIEILREAALLHRLSVVVRQSRNGPGRHAQPPDRARQLVLQGLRIASRSEIEGGPHIVEQDSLLQIPRRSAPAVAAEKLVQHGIEPRNVFDGSQIRLRVIATELSASRLCAWQWHGRADSRDAEDRDRRCRAGASAERAPQQPSAAIVASSSVRIPSPYAVTP